jgi:dolichol-phosphate mannosyltransferase
MSREHRSVLAQPGPWLTGLVALAMFSPVIIWNAQHDWASFAFQSSRTSEPNPNMLRDAGLFWVYQLGVTGVLALALFAMACVRGVKRGWLRGDDRWNFAMSFSLPLFGLFAAASFRTQVHVNWTMPAFLSLTVAGAAVFVEGLDGPQPRQWRAGAWTVAIIGLVATVFFHLILATGQPEILAYSHVGGWRQLAKHTDVARVELAERTGQQPFLLGADKYNIAAELSFYLRHPEDCVNLYALGAHGLSFRFWTDLTRFEGRPAVVVAVNVREKLLSDLARYFDRVDPPQPVPVDGPGRSWSRAQLIRCYGYRREPRPAS